nr:hypothetical protein [Tanacetum cinerariifolium]
IDETDCYHENGIRLIERLLYDKSSPRPPKEFVFKNSDADIESFSPSPIPDEDSDSLCINVSGLPPCSAITPNEPVLSTEESDNSLNMGDEHLDTIPATELDDQFEDLSESNEAFSSIDDDSFSFDKIDYVEASPPDSELASSEVMEIVIPEVGGIEDDILCEKLLNKESDFFLEVDAFLAVEDEPTLSQFPKSYLDPEGDILLLESFLNDDHSSDFKTKSSSTSLNSLLEETNNFDTSLPEFTTFSNVLFDAEYESNSSDDQSCSDEDVLEKIIDSLLDEFAGELALFKSIPPGIDETDCDFEEDIRLIKKLLYDNSSSRPSEEFVYANSNAKSESFSPSPILVKDSDSLMKEIDLLCTPDYPMPSGIVDADYDSKRDILILRTCLAIIPFHLLKKSHSILIFLRFLVLLQNHQMVIQEF